MERVNVNISKIADQEDYVLKSSNSEHYFKIAKHVIEGLNGFDRANMVEAKVEPQGEAVIPCNSEK